MAEQTAERSQSSGKSEEHIEVKVLIHRKTMITVRVRKGSTIDEILDEVWKQCATKGIILGKKGEWKINFNNKLVQIDENTGRVKDDQNEHIAENASLALTQKVQGG